MVEGESKGEVAQRGWEVGQWAIESFPENKVGDEWRKFTILNMILSSMDLKMLKRREGICKCFRNSCTTLQVEVGEGRWESVLSRIIIAKL